MGILLPLTPINITPPDDDISEADKFANNGFWFLQKARFYCWQYYNNYSVNQSYLQPSAGGTVTASGQPLSSMAIRSIVDEMLENYDYYNIDQQNLIFNHITTGAANMSLPNIWIQGGEVRQLCDHILGKAIKQIEPIEKTISAESISPNSLLKRQDIFDKIDLGAAIGQDLNDLGGGDVKYQPTGNVDYSNPIEVKQAREKVRSEYEETATIIARSAYYKNGMEDMFKTSALDTILCNLTGMEFTEKDGQMSTTYIPGFSGIYDYSTWGEYGEGQTKAGYIVPVTLDEVLKQYPDMNPQWIEEIRDVLYNQIQGSQQFIDYYNAPFTRMRWWNPKEKWMSKATVYWLGKMDTRYKKKSTQFGGKKVQMIDDYKVYQIDTGRKDERGNRVFESKKGSEIKGDSSTWMVHKAVILGNKWLLEYGYDSYQVRPYGDKSRPEIPIKWLCQGKIAGYVKPIASRLKPKQAEIDAVRYRIRDYVASDMWGIFINGQKLTESLSALDIVTDLKSVHATVIPGTGEADDLRGINDIVKVVQSGVTALIKDYLELKQDIMREMQAIIGVTEISLGDQSTTIGKGVQQETINRSELSGLNLYHSLNEYWRRCIQFAANKSKLIMLDNSDKNVILPISAREVQLLKLTKGMKDEDISVYLSPDDSINDKNMATLNQSLIAYSVNPSLEAAEALANILKMFKAKSFNEGIALFETYIEQKRQENEKKAMQESANEHLQQSTQQQSAQILAMQEQIAKLTGDLAKINLEGAWTLKTQEAKAGLDNEARLSDAYIESITQLIQEQLAAVNQPQGQPQAEAQPA